MQKIPPDLCIQDTKLHGAISRAYLGNWKNSCAHAKPTRTKPISLNDLTLG